MKKFQGHPQSSHRFDKECSQFSLQYTQAHCQEAFNFLAKTGDLEKTIVYYGEKVEGCFNSADLERLSAPKE